MMKQLIGLAIAAGLAVSASSAYAAKIVDADALPSGFASQVEDKNGKKQWVFNTNGYMYTADTLNKVMMGYGGKLTEKSAEMLPRGFASMVEKDKKKVWIFGQNGYAWTATTLNKVMNAYGMNYNMAAGGLKGLSSVFKDDKDKDQVSFTSTGYAWSPSGLNRMLKAYK